MNQRTQNKTQFPEVAKVCRDFQQQMGAKVKYARNTNGDEKGQEEKLNLGENLLELVK